MKVAIQGCLHGELDRVYEILQLAEERTGIKIDLLICCGDFQAARDCGDLNCMAVPPKYRHMQSFYKYYSGEKKAPMLTIFIGGNHEASNHLWELSYGGWVAPNMYYLGNAGVVRYGGLRIAGISGIYNDKHFRINHFEAPPYNPGSLRSAYHVRSCDVFRLKQLSGNFDIMLSHDWPASIYHHGDKFLLIRLKPYFEEEILCNTLGSPAAMDLLQLHKPTYWFSGHLHVKFAAVYYHLQPPPPHQPAHYRGHAPPLMSLPSKEPPQKETPKEGEGGADEGGVASQESGGVVPQEGEGGGDTAEDSAMVVQDGSGGVGANQENATTESGGEVTEGKKSVDGSESAEITAEGGAGDTSSEMVAEPGGVATGEEEEHPPIKYTKFLALDKPLPKKRFLQILDINPSDPCDVEQPYRLEYDREWLAILKSTEPLMKYTQGAWLPPHPKTDTRLEFTPTSEELEDIDRRFSVEGYGSRLVIPENFVATVPPFVDGSKTDFNAAPIIKENPQTVEFCEKLGIENPFKPKEPTEAPPTDHTPNPDEIDVDDEAGEGDSSTVKAAPEPDGYKGQLGEGLLEWQVDTQTTSSNQPPITTKLPLNLPPPTLTTSPDQSEPMPQSHDAGEEVESKTGIKRALSLSPNAVSHDTSIGSGDPVVGGDSSKSESKGPELKRRNVALYASEETEEA